MGHLPVIFHVAIYLGAAALLIAVTWEALKKAYDAVWARLVNRQHDLIDLARRRQALKTDNIRVLQPDLHGRQGVAYDGRVFRDLDSKAAYTMDGNLYLEPVLERLNAVQKTLLALTGGGWPDHFHYENVIGDQMGGAPGDLPALEAAAVQWPKVVTLRDLAQRYGHRPGLHSLLLGETWQDGAWQPVIGDLTAMVHVLVSGASGFGKSTLLEAMAKQLAMGGDCDLCFVDYGVNTFGRLADYGLYPVADTPDLAVALFRELIAELHRRRRMFQEYPAAKSLEAYNQATGGDLRPIVCFVDESAALFQKDGTREPATELAQMGRKFGLGLVFAGTDFKASTLPTEASGNFGARIAMHLRPSLSQSLLYCKDAANLRDKGRALALLPGVGEMVEMQCPIVRDWDDLPEPRPTIELAPATTAGSDPDQAEQRAQVLALHRAGESLNAIQRAVFGYTGGAAYDQVRAILDGDGNTTTETSTGEPGQEAGADSSSTGLEGTW